MPCRYDPTPDEIRVGQKSELDRLTRENDELREVIISLINDHSYKVPTKIWLKINKSQTAHRKEDLKRLEQTFIASKDTEKLAKVWAADPSQPLEPQLGFNPDSF